MFVSALASSLLTALTDTPTSLSCYNVRQGVDSSVRRSLSIVKDDSGKLLADVPARNKAAATATLATLKTSLQEFQVIVANKDKQEARMRS